MPVDYSKWDKLELSDDEDFECHPNVDKASMVRWKQADIHRVRRERKDKLSALSRESKVNSRVTTAIRTVASTASTVPPPVLLGHLGVLHRDCHTWTEELKEAYMSSLWTERDARWGAPEPDAFVERRAPYGDLVEAVMKTVAAFPDAGVSPDQVRREVEMGASTVVEAIEARQREVDAEVKREEEEAAKKLTTDDLHDGFNKTVVSKKADPPKVAEKTTAATSTKGKTKVVETIHTPNSGAAAQADVIPPEEEDDEADHITYAPAQLFADQTSMEASFEIIGKHPHLVSQRFSDMILAEAFRKELDGQPKVAQRCVQQALLLQYCSLLGKDGISMFFARLRSNQVKATEMFTRDVKDTYARIHTRVGVIKQQQKEETEAEQTQLRQRLEACTLPDGTLAIPVPEGADEGERRRAEVFAGFPHEFQRALLMSDVDAINAHLGSLDKKAGQDLVQVCNEVGLLSLELEEASDGDGEAEA
ncbi:hsp90 co-chaperone Cdc37 [Thoreauomyces humboldtii]|nr:hsp90 co-chaperone Cdc37 [Thoreauomyces humboldtii]